MNNLLYLNKDPILTEFNNSVDKESTKKMLAFKYFNNNLSMLNDYLNSDKKIKNNISPSKKAIKSNTQLEFSF
tara:strand:+ start:4535 stop:4753 length:219 start_codon:yes stop_codon:yes gene_type:complete